MEYKLTKKGSTIIEKGIVRKGDLISEDEYKALPARQRGFFEKFVEPARPVDEMKALEKKGAELEKKVADLQKINSTLQKKNEAQAKEIAELQAAAKPVDPSEKK